LLRGTIFYKRLSYFSKNCSGEKSECDGLILSPSEARSAMRGISESEKTGRAL